MAYPSAPAEQESLCPASERGKGFFLLEGGEHTLAISKKRKQEMLADYQKYLERSQAVVLAEYIGLSMKDLEALRSKVREAGGEFRVVKNTLAERAFQQAGYSIPQGYFTGSTAASFAFADAPTLVRTIMDFARTNEFFKIKGGYLEFRPVSAEQVKALAELPTLPVLRARLLGVLLAPASQLARTLAEPGRQVAAVLKAHLDRQAAAEPAA